MRLVDLILPDVREALARAPEEIRPLIEDLHPVDAAEVLLALGPEERTRFLAVLAVPDQVAVLEELEPELRADLFASVAPGLAQRLIAAMSADELREAWPFGGLLGPAADAIASVPVPFPRHAALAGSEVVLQFADVETPAERPAFAALLAVGKQPAGAGPDPAGVEPDEEGSPTPAELAFAEPADAPSHRGRVEPTRFLKDDLVESTDDPVDSRVAQAIERAGIEGVSVAPPARSDV